MSKLRTENAATLAAFLAYRNDSENVPETVEALQKTARMLHRNAERACCEDCGCENCEGTGEVENKANGANRGRMEPCHYCAGTGLVFGKREDRAMESLRKMLEPFHVILHKQGDCRGWPLYLIPEEWAPSDPDGLGLYRYPSDPDGGATIATLRARWIASNYNRGIAVCPH